MFRVWLLVGVVLFRFLGATKKVRTQKVLKWKNVRTLLNLITLSRAVCSSPHACDGLNNCSRLTGPYLWREDNVHMWEPLMFSTIKMAIAIISSVFVRVGMLNSSHSPNLEDLSCFHPFYVMVSPYWIHFAGGRFSLPFYLIMTLPCDQGFT